MPDTITVRILEARNLLAADRGGTSDPYALIRVDNTKHKTKIIKKCLNPKWMETFKFTVLNPKSTKVVIEVWDKDVFKKDDPLGCISISLNGLEKGVEKLEWHNLNGVPKGQIYVGITADNFDTVTPLLKSNYPSNSLQPPPSQMAQNFPAYNSDPFAAYPPNSGAPQSAYPPPLYSSQPNYSNQAGGYPPALNYPPPIATPSYPPMPNQGYPPQQYGSSLPPNQAQPNQYPPQSNYPPQQYGSSLPPNQYPPQTQQYGSSLPPNQYPPQVQQYGSSLPPNQAPQAYPPQGNGYPAQPNNYPNYNPAPPQGNGYASQQNYPPM